MVEKLNMGNIIAKDGELPERWEAPSQSELDHFVALFNAGYHAELESLAHRLLEQYPKSGFIWKALGASLQMQAKDALYALQKAAELLTGDAEAHYNLGVALQGLGQLDNALASYRHALEIMPNYADAHNNVGGIQKDLGQLDNALASYRQALEIRPDDAGTYNNLGGVLKDLGQLDNAVKSYRRALKLKPDYAEAHSNLLFALNYHPDKSCEEIFAAYREYDERFGLPFREKWRTQSNNRETNRRLKVGYVSPDFWRHSVRHFLEPLLSHHDKNVVKVYAYAELTREDAVTTRYQGYVDCWVPTRGMSDEALAERIRADGIDILVDLAGHTAQNRLQVFARKPAPVSLSWLGFGYTTGLTAVDYLLTDTTSVPQGSEELLSETPWRLTTPGYAYRPAEDMGEVNPLPAAQRGYITFGTLTRAVRINHRTIRVWSAILKRVKGARLVIDSRNYRDASMQNAVAKQFAVHGISKEQLEIGCHSPPWDVLRGMDIGLDCFPHNSGTTLFESMYMGVPFVTLAARPSVGRLGSSILEGAGYPEWIAHTEDEYVEIAVALASDLQKLASIRSGLRRAMEMGPLMDEAGFTRKVEAAYREMWAKWATSVPAMNHGKKNQMRTEEHPLLAKVAQLAREGKTLKAKQLCLKVLQDDPGNAQAHYLLGSALLMENKSGEAIASLTKSLELAPDQLDALNNLGIAYGYSDISVRNYDRAISCFKRIVEIAPSDKDAIINLGNMYMGQNELDSAEACFQRVLARDPDNMISLNNMGALYTRRRQRERAVEYYKKAVAISPQDGELTSNLLTSLIHLKRWDEALELTKKAVHAKAPGAAIFPAFSFAMLHALWDEAELALPEVLRQIKSGKAQLNAFENACLPLLASERMQPEELLSIHKAAGHVIERLATRTPFTFSDAQEPPQGRLKVGYVSPDFRQHVVSAFFRGLINHHDRERFEVYCYSNVKHGDVITRQYEASADVFVNVSELSDLQLAERIHADGIHFLVDLAGYTQHGRITALAYRPSPVQIMYLGYPYTSGLQTVDYFISDPFLDGPENARYFTEQQLHLPESFITFDHLHEQHIDTEPPVARNGRVTFGSLNNIYKLNPHLIAIWSRILQRVAHSKLIINHPNCAQELTRKRLILEFQRNGIEADQVEIVWENHPDGSHLRYYKDIDIALDTFPQTGGTTTIDAVWMGVPVVTMVGKIYPHRLSYSVLSNIGLELDDLIAFDDEEYVTKAVALAHSPERIADLHRSIPVALKTSILCDPVRLTRHMENAYIEAWNRKFPSHPVRIELPLATELVPIFGGAHLAVANSLDNLETYVLKEQMGWFDPEYRFVVEHLTADMRIVDINAGIGFYSIPLAAKAAGGGVWATTRTPSEGRLLEMSKKHNQLDKLCVLIKGDRKLNLDLEMHRAVLVNIDFVRLDLQAKEKELLDDASGFFAANSPLVMFNVEPAPQDEDVTVASTFRKWGYDIYRLIPGLNLLAPLSAEDHIGAFTLNLFACRVDCAAKWERQNHLVSRVDPLADFPGVDREDWANYLYQYPYARVLRSDWETHFKSQPDWEAYWSALNLYALSRNERLTGSARLAALRAASGIALMLCQVNASVPKLLTLARILVDIGEREQAAQVLQRLVGHFEADGDIALLEPFLPLSEYHGRLEPNGHLAQWLLASILEQLEKWRTFTSFFGGEESLAFTESVLATGFASPEIIKRHEVILARNRARVGM